MHKPNRCAGIAKADAPPWLTARKGADRCRLMRVDGVQQRAGQAQVAKLKPVPVPAGVR
jgi:hypothetical protein